MTNNQSQIPYKLRGIPGVYVIHRLEDETSFKIGHSQDLYARLHSHFHKYEQKVVIDYVLICSNSREVESNLHSYFKDKQIGASNSEWFSLSEDDLTFIKAVKTENISQETLQETLTHRELDSFKSSLDDLEKINNILLGKKELDPELELAFLAISLMLKPVKETVRLHMRRLMTEKYKQALEYEVEYGRNTINAVRILAYEE